MSGDRRQKTGDSMTRPEKGGLQKRKESR